MRKVGDIITIEATGDFAPGIKCEVLEVSPEGRILKMKSLIKDERLLRMGFLIEGEDYVAIEWNWSEN